MVLNESKSFCFLVLLTILISCSPYKKNIPSKVFHNTTAHYNAVFIAKEKILEIENTLAQGYQWNYNKILPIFPQFDSADAAGFAQLTEDCIEKASIAIQRHPNSKWVDNSYNLVGQARFYSMDFPNAIETFKYVNTNGEGDDERHEALISLMRTFVEAGELNNAEAVSDFLKREKLNKQNLKTLYLNRGYLYQKREDYNSMVSNLNRAEPLLAAKDEPARIHFIIGQVYQELGFESEAYNNYNECLKKNPPYELSFYAKLNMAQVTQLANPGDLKKVRKYFRGLLTDEKNKEYKDKIYYEMGNFEMKQGNLTEAIGFYEASVQASVNNNRQKAYSYLSLSEIYYDSLADYRTSKLYYDSTLQNMPKDEEIYAAIEERQQILEDFVKQIDIIETNDSLLYLASLDTASLYALLDGYIAEQTEKEEERKRKEKEQKDRPTSFSVFDQNQGNLISTSSNDATWYFYNSVAISQGSAEFNRKWGNRVLEDNWRRSSKEQTIIANNTPVNTGVEDGKANKKDEESAEIGLSRESLVATIPYDEAQQAGLLAEVEEALYQLGTIYYFQLKEKQSSSVTFEQLLSRFPETVYAPEVLYELYLIYEDLDQPEDRHRNRELLLNNYPESIYAKLILNPNYREESQAISSQLKKVYEKSYAQYRAGEYDKALASVNASLEQYPDNEFSDNLDLLKILIIGKTSDVYKYQYELNNFIKNYSESELAPYAQTLVKASEDYQINLFNSAKAKFIKDFDQKHYFVLVYKPEGDMAETIPELMDQFIERKYEDANLVVGNLILDADHSIILVNEFQNRTSAEEFFEDFSSGNELFDNYVSTKFDNFVLTYDNFNIFYQTKDVEAYKKFFKENY